MTDQRYRGTWHPYWAGWQYMVDDCVAGELLDLGGGQWLPRLADWLGPDYPTFSELPIEPADQDYIRTHQRDLMITLALAVARAADERTSAHVR